jgi:class 3 adenylate cyclase/CHASE2 domain-containing sensor protein
MPLLRRVLLVLSRFLRPVRGAVCGLSCAVIAWGLAQVPMVRGLEDWLLDGSFVLRGKRSTSSRILVVDVDDASLRQLKKPMLYLSPELAAVVDYLSELGAAAVGVDILIPDTYSTLAALQRGGPGDATTMGEAIKRAGKVVLPVWQVAGKTLRPLAQWQLKALGEEMQDPTDFGFVNLTEDGDQFVRRQQLAVATVAEKPGFGFALALLAKSRGVPISWDPARAELELDGDAIPLDRDQMLRINFAGPPGTFPTISLSEVLKAARARQSVPQARGAIVIIGSVAQAGQDVQNTPYSNRYADYLHRLGAGLMSGPELHANVIATVHDRAFIATPWWLSSLPWLLALGAALGQAFFRIGLLPGFILAVLHHFGWKALATGAFLIGNWRVEMGGMLVLGALAYSVAFAWRWRVLRQVLRAVKSAPIAQALEMDPGRLRLGGESREITVLFTDLRDFTAFSERHSSAQAVALLNTYYQLVVPLIEAEGGVIDKFIGDGLMVLFGAIPDREDHAAAAVRSAVKIVRAVEDHRHLWTSLGYDGLRVGIGIHTGPVLLGAVGSTTRLDFTAIGDTVNAASRVEGENKRIGSTILITSATRAAVPVAEQRRIGILEHALPASVKGKQAELSLYVVEDPQACQRLERISESAGSVSDARYSEVSPRG